MKIKVKQASQGAGMIGRAALWTLRDQPWTGWFTLDSAASDWSLG